MALRDHSSFSTEGDLSNTRILSMLVLPLISFLNMSELSQWTRQQNQNNCQIPKLPCRKIKRTCFLQIFQSFLLLDVATDTNRGKKLQLSLHYLYESEINAVVQDATLKKLRLRQYLHVHIK